MQLNIFNPQKQIKDKKKPQPIKEEVSRDVDKDWKLYHSLIKSFSGF